MSAKLRKAAPIGRKVTLLLLGNGVNHSYRYEFSPVFLILFLFCFNIATKYVCKIAKG